MNPNTRPSDRTATLGVISPATHAAGSAVSTAWIKLDQFQSLKATLLAGVLGASATLDFKLEQANTAAGGDVKDVEGKAITQLTKAGSDDNAQAVIDLSADELDVANGFYWVRATATPGTANSAFAAIVEGYDPRYAPARDYGATSVAETVN